LLREDGVQTGIRSLTERVGLRVINTMEVEGRVIAPDTLSIGEAIVFDQLAIAVIAATPDQIRALSNLSGEDSGILAVEPERVIYPMGEADTSINPDAPLSSRATFTRAAPEIVSNHASAKHPFDYLAGYRDAVNHIVERVLNFREASPTRHISVAAPNELELTWGLQITKVAQSRYSGKGVRVAVLDTGFDSSHPDFTGRNIVTQSFIVGETAQDGHGHGTHCIGTACGPQRGSQLPRYGIAYDAEIFAGKVLSNRGSGTDSSVLAGIQWAITNRCAVISMSLGTPIKPGQSFSSIYEAVGRRALAAGTLIIAAAGNESHRPKLIKPVAHPANCPSIMAVTAIDTELQVASFSCGGINVQGGQVDIAGPGVAVRSSWLRPELYRTINGTSMATPHVAGIAALLAEQNPDVRGGALGWLLLQSARRLELPARDIGAGLVQAT
jgi:subtilisin family serine protease